MGESFNNIVLLRKLGELSGQHNLVSDFTKLKNCILHVNSVLSEPKKLTRAANGRTQGQTDTAKYTEACISNKVGYKVT